MTHDPMCQKANVMEIRFGNVCSQCDLIARVREDEGNRYDGMAVVHWDAGYQWGLHDAEVTGREQSLRKGLWIGWAIGTLLMVIPLIVLAVQQ